MKRVVITGMGAITPLGNTINATWNNLLNGESGTGLITRFNTEKSKTKIACEVKNYEPKDHLDRKDANKLDFVSQFALIASSEAINQSGIKDSNISPERIGVIWATGNGGAITYDTAIKEFYASENGRFSPYFVPKVLLDTSSGIISIKNGFKGVNYTTVAACASGTTAICDAFNYIRWGKADAIVTGGSDAPICPSLISGFNSLKALSTKNEAPYNASRPFDIDRDGFVMGEGGVSLILESYDSAIERNANIIAEVVGGGINADAYHMTAGHPEGEGAISCMNLALEEAGINFDKIDYLNAHATSTPVGDLAEINAISKMSEKNSPIIGATKSMTGHLMGAAGALEGAICALVTKYNKIPPTINVEKLDPNIPEKMNLAPDKMLEKEINYAMSNNFGFGGHNGSVIIKKYQ